jgi:hypothetical protein
MYTFTDIRPHTASIDVLFIDVFFQFNAINVYNCGEMMRKGRTPAQLGDQKS